MITLQELHERDKRPPSVTVVMYCYNHSKYIDKAIRSVLMQKTNFPVNIVIHDDASPDGSADIIRRYAAENSNITAILQPVNLYQQHKSSLPYVLPYYTGKYLAYCECDDFWLDEHKLQIQVDYLEANPDCMSVYSNTLPVNKDGEYDESERMPHFRKTPEGDYSRWRLFGVRHQTASCVIRNFWQFTTPEERDFYMRMRGPGDQRTMAIALQMGRVHYFSEEFAAYRHVKSEGDSFSARIHRMKKYDRFKYWVVFFNDMYKMLEYFFGKRPLRRYLDALFYELEGLIKYRKSMKKELGLKEWYQDMPWYTYPAFPFWLAYKVVLKLSHIPYP